LEELRQLVDRAGPGNPVYQLAPGQLSSGDSGEDGGSQDQEDASAIGHVCLPGKGSGSLQPCRAAETAAPQEARFGVLKKVVAREENLSKNASEEEKSGEGER
jgi:hypothetical protein